MSTITTGVGLISGIDIGKIVDAMIKAKHGAIDRLQERVSLFQQENQAIQTLEANVLGISTALQTFKLSSTFNSTNVSVSDPSVLEVNADSGVTPGSYTLQALRTAKTHELYSSGWIDTDETPVGEGSLVFSTTGFLDRPTSLDLLNGGAGVRRGQIRITDRSGRSADIDLSNGYTVDDVLKAINSNDTIDVQAMTDGNRLVLVDTSGGAGELSVTDLSGHAAEDLGIAQSVASDTLVGDEVYHLTEAFSLDLLNDGNTLYRISGAPDMKITLTDGTSFDVTLDDAHTLGDVLDAINNHPDNNGKLTASLSSDGRIVLTDSSGGTGTLSVENINGSSVVRQLGLDVSASGGVLEGRVLLAGMNSVLLRNLRGGRGITQLGQISLTDRAGRNAIIDLSNAHSLDEVLYAINSARTSNGEKLQLEAHLDSFGTGIEIVDTSGSTASNLIIKDVGTGTLASELGIAVDAAQDSVQSGPLYLQEVSESTSLTDYTADGNPIAEGSILITDSAGNQETIYFSSSVQTIGDVLLRLNSAQNVAIRAELNETGDGIVLIDEAGGSGTLKVEEVDSTTAADLRLLGTATTVQNQQQIVGRNALVVDVDADDTLSDVVQKINDAGGPISASIINTGAAINPYRLMLRAEQTGLDGRFSVENNGTQLSFAVGTQGENALLRVGGENGYLYSSSTNSFNDVLSGLDVHLLKESTSPVTVNVSRDTEAVKDALQTFIDRYNTFRNTVKDMTKFDSETNERGPLQGSTFVLRVASRLESILNHRFEVSGSSIHSLAELGVTVQSDGTLKLDEDVLDRALSNDFNSVTNFFQDENAGFVKLTDSVLETLTDTTTGAFVLQENSLQQSIDSLNDRIDDLETMLESERERLTRQFIAMEQALGALQDQQQALLQLSQAAANMRSSRSSR